MPGFRKIRKLLARKQNLSVPKGKSFEFTLANSQAFPGTTRKITVYVPAGDTYGFKSVDRTNT
jgi:hypothetical protein